MTKMAAMHIYGNDQVKAQSEKRFPPKKPRWEKRK